jgi:drug/metabolite transporter (DMT)-like permease
VAFLAESVLAGGNAVAIRFSNRELDPLWGATIRFLLAGAVLLVVMRALRLALPRGRALRGALLYGLFIGGAFAFGYYSLVRLHAGLVQTIFALIPLATLLLAALQRQERMRVAGLAGALLALVGVGLLSAPSGRALPVLSLLAVLGAVLCFAQATILGRRFPEVHPVTMNAVGMSAAGLLLLAGSAGASESFHLPDRAATWAAIAFLVAIGSVAVFVLYLIVLHFWDASRAAYGFVITPIVTVALSAWLDHEPIGSRLLLGALFVLAGVYVGALRRPPRAA